MRLWARTPLRVKIVATVLALVTAALALAGFAAATSLRSYLVARVDTQLVDYVRHPPGRGGGGGGPGDFDSRFNPYYTRHATADGTVTSEPSTDHAPDLPTLTAQQAIARERRPFTVGSKEGHGQWRAVAAVENDGDVVTVARALTDETSTVNRLVWLEVIIGATVLVVLGGLGYVSVERSLRPLAAVEHTAGAIAAGDLSQRVPEADPRTEVGRLSAAFNAMLHQIESAFREREASEAAARQSEERMRRFVADASHELRTPLTSIRGFAELYRQGAASPDEVPRLMRRIEDEGARMGLLVDDLLLLARLDRERPLAHDAVDLVPLAADAVHDARAVDPSRDVTLTASGSCEVVGDEPRLRQVLANLVGNALTHTPPGTPVEVRVRADGDAAVVEVADHGPGLTAEAAEKVFERFYRADAARDRASGGAGLGLAIVAALAAAHGGSVSVDTAPGQGATFRVRLPLRRQERGPNSR